MISPGRGMRAVLKISAGTAAAQAITVAAAPIITRIFSPAEFGLYTVIASVAAIVAAVAPLRWDFAITLPDNERDAHSLTFLALASAFLVSLLSLILVWSLSIWISELRDLWPWMLLMPLVALAQGVLKVLNQLAIRHQRYSAIATRALLRSTAVVGTQIGLGLAGLRSGGLVIGLALGNFVGILGLLRGAGFGSPEGRAGRTFASVKVNAVHYRRFPLFLAPAALVNVLGTQLPVLLIAYFYGASVAGWFGLTQSAIALPVAVVGQAVAQVYLGELSVSLRKGRDDQRRLFDKVSVALGAVAALIFVLLVAVAPSLFPVVFGDSWANSGVYAAALAPGLAMQVLAVPTSQTLSLLGRQDLQLLWDIGRLLTSVGILAGLAVSGVGATTAVLALGLVNGLAYAVLWFLARRTVYGSPAGSASH